MWEARVVGRTGGGGESGVRWSGGEARLVLGLVGRWSYGGGEKVIRERRKKVGNGRF